MDEYLKTEVQNRLYFFLNKLKKALLRTSEFIDLIALSAVSNISYEQLFDVVSLCYYENY